MVVMKIDSVETPVVVLLDGTCTLERILDVMVVVLFPQRAPNVIELKTRVEASSF